MSVAIESIVCSHEIFTYRYLDDNLLTEIDTDYFSGGLEQLTLL